jgi:hypothetical protein
MSDKIIIEFELDDAENIGYIFNNHYAIMESLIGKRSCYRLREAILEALKKHTADK